MPSRLLTIVSASVLGPLLLGSIAFAEETTDTTTPEGTTEETSTTESPLLRQHRVRKEAKSALKKEAFEKLKGINAESKEKRTAAREQCKEEKTTIQKSFVEQVQTLTGKENKDARKSLVKTTKESLKTTREGCKEERKAIKETTKEKRRTTKTELKDRKKALKNTKDAETGEMEESSASVLESVWGRKNVPPKSAHVQAVRASDLGGAGRRTAKVPSARSAALDAKKRLKLLKKSAAKNPSTVETETEGSASETE